MAIEPKLMTADELLRLPDDGQRHELVRGELRTMPPAGFRHGNVAMRCSNPLSTYVWAHRLGSVVVGDVGFRLASDPDIIRAPDVAFVRQDRLDEQGEVGGFWPGAPDLAIEVISPNDRYVEVEEKVTEWLAAGTRLVFVVNPRQRTVAIHRPGQAVRILTEQDSLDGEEVIPGWTMPVRDLFLV